MKKFFKRIASSIAAAALAVTAILSSFPSMTASAAAGDKEKVTLNYVSMRFNSSAQNYFTLNNGHKIGTGNMYILYTSWDGWSANYSPTAKVNDGAICIHEGAPLDSYMTYEEENAAAMSYWQSFSPAQRYTIGLILHYGFPEASTDLATYFATQMLVWEAQYNTRIVKQSDTSFASYRNPTNGHGLNEFLYAVGNPAPRADLAAAAKVKYNEIVEKIATMKSRFGFMRETEAKVKSDKSYYTLSWNSSKGRYEKVLKDLNQSLWNDFDLSNTWGKAGFNVEVSNSTVSGSKTYTIWTKSSTNGVVKTASTAKKSTAKANSKYNNVLVYGNSTNPYAQQIVFGGKGDEVVGAVGAITDSVNFKVIKTSVQGEVEDSKTKLDVVLSAKFRIYDTESKQYIKATGGTNGVYTYSSSNASTSEATVFSLDQRENISSYASFTLKNAPRNLKVKVLEIETAANYEIPDEYKYIDEAKVVTLNKDTTEHKMHNNSSEVPVRLLKITEAAADGNKYVSGILFTIKGVNNDVNVQVKTDSQGVADFGYLPAGDYIVSEDGTTVNQNYGTIASKKVTISSSDSTVEFKNPLRTVGINVVKKDNLGNVVSGVKFNVINNNSKAILYKGKSIAVGGVVTTLTTDSKGTASVKDLPLDPYTYKASYKVQETGVYAPYVVTNQSQTANFDSATTWSRTVTYQSKSLTFTNTIQKGNITITKKDGNGKPITSDTATFEISYAEDYVVSGHKVKSKGDKVGTFTTDKTTGSVTVKDLYANAKLTVKETKAPYGYNLDKTSKTFTVSFKDTVNLQYVDVEGMDVRNASQSGSISAYKYVMVNGTKRPLANAVFTLTAKTDVVRNGETIYKAGEVIQEGKTNDKGEFKFKEVPTGFTYILTEKQAPDGYVNAHPKKEIELSYNSEVEFVEAPAVSVENTPTRVYVSKQRLGDDAEVKDAQMQLLDATGKEVDSWTSDGKEHLVEKLVPGTYTIHEVRQPNGYVIAEDISFTIDDQNNVTLIGDVELKYKDKIPLIVMHDDQTVVEISKTDITTSKEIEGAELVVYDKNNNVIDSWTSEANKSHKIVGKLVVGETYRLVETSAPDGYLISNEVTFKVEGRTNNGKAIVQKVEMKDDYTKLSIKKTDKETGDTLEGAVLQLIDSKGKVYKQWTTKTTAERIDRIPLGTYTLHEVSAPKGYVKFADETIEIKAEDFENGKIKNVTVADGITHVEIEKTSITDGKRVIGAHLVIKDSNGDVFAEWDTEDEVFTIKRMPIGDYTLTETYAPDGFVISNTVPFTVDEKETIQKVSMIDDVTKVKIDKFEAKEGKNLKGAVLQIIDTTTDKVVDEWETDETSHNIIGKLVAGRKYILREVSAPVGYVVADDVEFTVSTDGKEDYTSITDNTTQIDFSKKSITGDDELPGAKLAVYDSDDNKIVEWVSGDKPYVLDGVLKAGSTYKLVELIPADGFTTAESIEFTVSEKNEIQHIIMRDKPTEVEFSKKTVTGDDELPGARLTLFDSNNEKVAEWTSGDKPYVLKGILKVGQKYRLHEEVAPDGYIVANDIEFEVIDERTVQHVTMVDDTTKVHISKKSATGGNELAGAKLQILDASGKVVVEWVSGDKPYIIEGVLKAGETYTLHEDLAPIGYQKASDIKFKVNEDGTVNKVEMIDEVIPQTGVTNDITVPVAIASGSAAIIAVALFLLLKRRNKKKDI